MSYTKKIKKFSLIALFFSFFISLIYYLEKNLNEKSVLELDNIHSLAVSKFKKSKQWQKRDKEFGFSLFLNNVIPPIDKRAELLLNKD